MRFPLVDASGKARPAALRPLIVIRRGPGLGPLLGRGTTWGGGWQFAGLQEWTNRLGNDSIFEAILARKWITGDATPEIAQTFFDLRMAASKPRLQARGSF